VSFFLKTFFAAEDTLFRLDEVIFFLKNGKERLILTSKSGKSFSLAVCKSGTLVLVAGQTYCRHEIISCFVKS